MQMPSIFRRIRQWINTTIQRRLIVWSGSFWVISIIILALVFPLIGRNQMITEARQRNVQLASMISRDVNAYISNVIGNTRTFTRRLETLGPDPYSQADAMLGLRLSSINYRAIYYFDHNETLLIHLTDTAQSLLSVKDPRKLVDRPPVTVRSEIAKVFKEVRGTSIHISDFYYTPLDYTPVLYIGMPVIFASGETRTVVFEIDLTDIWRRIEIASVGKTGFTYVVSREGIIIDHPDPTYLGSRLPAEIKPVLANYEGSVQIVDPVTGRDALTAYSPVGGLLGWGIVVSQEMGEIYAPIEKAGSIIILILLALGVIGTVSILVFVGNFSKPIQELTQTAQHIANTGNLAKIGTLQRSDEIGQLSQSFDRMIEKVKNTEEQRENAAANERNRLARDLHDAVSQTLFSASLIAEVLPRLWEKDPDEGRKRLAEVRQLTRGALAEMRTLLFELRPSALADAELGDLLRQLAEAVTGRARIFVSAKVEGHCHLPVDTKIAFYRIAQEALNNITKHSGADSAEVLLLCNPGTAELMIKDNGRGFNLDDAYGKSLGLGIMHERAKAVGASLEITSAINKGTEIKARFGIV